MHKPKAIKKTTKVMIALAVIILVISLIQGGITALLLQKDFKNSSARQVNAAMTMAQKAIGSMLDQIAADMVMLNAHKSIETYFAARYFEDEQKMVESVASIEWFFQLVNKSKSQYSVIQLTTIEAGPILEINNGKRVEKFHQFKKMLSPEILSKLLSQLDSIQNKKHIQHLSNYSDGQWNILSVIPVKGPELIDGLLFIYQPISIPLSSIFDNLEKADIVCVIKDKSSTVIASSKTFSKAEIAAFFNATLKEWKIISDTIPNLAWNVTVGISKKSLAVQYKRHQLVWVISLVVSLSLAIIALWGLKLNENRLEDKVEQKNRELEEKNILIQNNQNELQLALDQIYNLINEVTLKQSFGVYFKHPNLKRCWEEMACTKKDCPCYQKEPMRCWQIAGTLCETKNQGAFVDKYGDCEKCPFYKTVTIDPISQIGEQFNNMMHILEDKNIEVVSKNDELQETYNNLKIAQSQILQQEKMASIGQLAAGVAHEINNPMGFISSNIITFKKYTERMASFIQAQSLVINNFEEEKLQQLKEMRKKIKLDYIIEDIEDLINESLEGAKRVKEIVDNLKSFSRLDEEKVKAANINECIDSTIKVVWNELKYKVSLHKEYGELPLITCNPQQLNQVFVNLLVNAAHAIEENGDVTIKTWHDKDNIFIAFKDNGKGISEKDISRIFEPFFTTKEVGKGTGLGLSISYDIITNKHNGKIEVNSKEGEGTTFTVILPTSEVKVIEV